MVTSRTIGNSHKYVFQRSYQNSIGNMNDFKSLQMETFTAKNDFTD